MITDADLRRLHRYGISLCGNRDEALDIVQTALVKSLSARPGLVGLDIGYLYRAVRTTFIDLTRARGARPEIAPEPIEDDTASLETRSLEDLMIDREELEQVLSLLSPWERELLYLHLIEGHTADEVAILTGRPRGTILSMMHRLRKRIGDRTGRKSGGMRP